MKENLTILKTEALDAYDGNAAALARALGVTRQLVSGWADGPIGEVHALKLRFVLKPEIFSKPSMPIPAPSTESGQSVGACGSD